MEEVELTIVMPCLNEAQTIGRCIYEAQRFLLHNQVNGEILIADNGSEDDSPIIARNLGARVITVSQKGYGNALRAGIEAARGKYIIMGDCDLSYDFEHLEGFLENLRRGYHLVMGNRFLGGIQKGAMPFTHQYIGVPILSWLGRIRYKTDIGDFHCGLRGFEKEAICSLRLKSEGMEYATEMIGAFATRGYKIREIGTVLRQDGRNGPSHLRSVRDGYRHIQFMINNPMTDC